jgi:hypothetical protein
MKPSPVVRTIDLGDGRKVSIETGLLAKQADGSVIVRMGDTMLLATVVSAREAKEDVEIEGSTQTYATVTLQNFFRMYHKLAGMTGTAETEAQELWDIYKLDVVAIPTK